MQYIPENLKQVLNDRLKAGYVSKPKVVVEVDRMSFIPGYVEEVTFYDYDFVKTISEPITEKDEIVVTDVAATFPLGGKTWADVNKKFVNTSNYGWRVKTNSMHEGTDLATYGSPSDIVAMWDGKVVKVDKHKTAGNRVHVLHEGGYLTKYFHFKDGTTVVKIGQQVKAGQKLGVEGSTGNSSGQHLHVELWVGLNANATNTGLSTDPLPFIKGEKKIKGNKVQKKNTVTQEVTDVTMVEEVVAGKVVFDETFKSQSWEMNQAYNNYTPSEGVTFKNTDLKNGYFRPTWKFTASSVITARVALNLTMAEEGFFKFTFSGNFSGGDGDHIRVFVGKDLLYNTSQFNGIGKPTTSPNIKLPKGNVEIFIIIMYWGKLGASLKEFSLHDLKVQQIDTTIMVPHETVSEVVTDIPSNQTENYEYNEKEVKIQLQVGRFVYQDTLVLPNVQQCEVQRTVEQEASDAKLTISNPDGSFGPDYNPYFFPDLQAKNAQSPYSYTLPGGFHVGVLAENTPIRIYMGYGNEDAKPLRVFTGLIDAVTINSVEGTLDIAARDMYKKIINTVLMNRKVYGKAPEPITKEVSKQNTSTNISVGSLSRVEQIYYWAFKKCEEFGLPKDSAYFLLSICRHETLFGQAGQGKPPRNMILGYGSYNTNPDYSYGGIEKQMHYGAKRVKDALKSKGFLPKSYEDTKYFWKGGDYGNYQWATDTNWPNSVWAIYKEITANKSKYQPPSLGGSSTSTHTETVGQTTGEQWLKTAIIQDLIEEAGMYGWRSSVDDMRYPDSVVEESYVIEVNPKTGKVVKALSEEDATEEKKFETVPIESIKTTGGYLNPFVEPPAKTFIEFQWRIAEAIQDLIKDTNYRSYCDRFGTYRLELMNLEGPVVAEFKDDSNLISLSKTVDHTRSRSHMVVFHDGFKENGASTKDRVFASYIDKELLLELKGEVRTMTVAVPWAKTDAMKAEVAKKMFFQMKQMSRTLQASIPGNPALDLLDRVKVVDRSSATSAIYYIKSIRDSFDVDAGYIQMIDLTWAALDQIMQVQGLTVNLEPPVYEPPTPPAPKCEPWPGKAYKYGMKNDATVKKIQTFLISKGHKLKYGADGHFGSETQVAVKAYQKSQNIASDGIVGANTWNKMFCPTATNVSSTSQTAQSFTIRGTRSWRNTYNWKTDNDYIYQGQWENFGHHKGFIFLNHADVQAKLKGKKIKSVKLYLERYPKQGVHSAQYPTFWLHNLTGATGTPSMVSGTSWKSNVGWASNEKKWVTLPNSFGEALRDGKAKGIGIYTPDKTPYIYFYGASKVKFQIETH